MMDAYEITNFHETLLFWKTRGVRGGLAWDGACNPCVLSSTKKITAVKNEFLNPNKPLRSIWLHL